LIWVRNQQGNDGRFTRIWLSWASGKSLIAPSIHVRQHPCFSVLIDSFLLFYIPSENHIVYLAMLHVKMFVSMLKTTIIDLIFQFVKINGYTEKNNYYMLQCIDLIFQFVKINGYTEKNNYYMLQCGHVNEKEGGLNLQKKWTWKEKK